jgi:ubiquinone/menaquinone biosynthesis C-methylase UbiE
MKSNNESSNSFYNAVAEDYNSHMTEQDQKAREKVSKLFKQYVKEGCVLDFGGGTGLDLTWLKKTYKVFFLEPATNMRRIAQCCTDTNEDSHFIEENLDLANWSLQNLPFQEKMNGVLANFAVLNCMQNIDIFFKKIALVCEKNCYVAITVIDPSPYSLTKNYSIYTACKILFNMTVKMQHQYKNVYHETFIHSIGHLKQAASDNFNFITSTPIDSSCFRMLMFSKK